MSEASAEPDKKDGRNLGAVALEQLGYQSESPTWRNAYLPGPSHSRKPAALWPA